MPKVAININKHSLQSITLLPNFIIITLYHLFPTIRKFSGRDSAWLQIRGIPHWGGTFLANRCRANMFLLGRYNWPDARWLIIIDSLHDVGFARSRANFETNLLTDDDEYVCINERPRVCKLMKHSRVDNSRSFARFIKLRGLKDNLQLWDERWLYWKRVERMKFLCTRILYIYRRERCICMYIIVSVLIVKLIRGFFYSLNNIDIILK